MHASSAHIRAEAKHYFGPSPTPSPLTPHKNMQVNGRPVKPLRVRIARMGAPHLNTLILQGTLRAR
jgi:hypothetical protein